jgi:hypothetical protein
VGTEEDKVKHSQRRSKNDNAIRKQIKIAKAFGIPVSDAHKYVKHHAMNCGDPNCAMCANPRKMFGLKTFQEVKLEQDLEAIRDKHSNGLLIGEYMKFYVCDGLLFDSYQMAVNYANDYFRKFDIALNVEQVVKV